MKPITITLTTTIDEEIDQAIYGDFYAFTRFDPVHPGEVHPWVQMKQDGEWIPVQDWKGSRYMCTAATLRRLARHFIEVGKRLSGLIDLDEICRAAGISEPFMDGNQWSILKGANIQEGVVGFGDTKAEALVNFIKDIPIQQEQPHLADASKMEPEVDLEKFTEKIKTFQGRYKHPEIVSIKGAMAFMARMFYQYSNVARQWYESLPKATMD